MESDEYKVNCAGQGTSVSCEEVLDGGLHYGKRHSSQDKGTAIAMVAGSPGPAEHAETLGITMPLEFITLTALDIEYKLEHVDIPMDITTSYVEAAPHSGEVSVVTVKRLLKHIAGLTSITQRRSLEARKQLIRMKRKQDMIVARVEDEMTKLKKAMKTYMQPENGITTDEATGNVEVGYQEQYVAPPGTALDQQNKKDEGCALL